MQAHMMIINSSTSSTIYANSTTSDAAVDEFMADLRDFVDASHAGFQACLLPLPMVYIREIERDSFLDDFKYWVSGWVQVSLPYGDVSLYNPFYFH